MRTKKYHSKPILKYSKPIQKAKSNKPNLFKNGDLLKKNKIKLKNKIKIPKFKIREHFLLT